MARSLPGHYANTWWPGRESRGGRNGGVRARGFFMYKDEGIKGEWDTRFYLSDLLLR